MSKVTKFVIFISPQDAAACRRKGCFCVGEGLESVTHATCPEVGKFLGYGIKAIFNKFNL